MAGIQKRVRPRAVQMIVAGLLGLTLAVPGPANADIPAPDGTGTATVEPEADLGATATPTVAVPSSRLAGANRYETAAAISRATFPGGARTAYLARGDLFADAIAAGSLTDGPVLLVNARCGSLPAAVATELGRLDPDRVVALGGPLAVCDETLRVAAGERTAERLGGEDRFATAALIARRAFPEGARTVYLAEHRESADAVAGGTLTDGPVLLVWRGSPTPDDATQAAVEVLDPERVVALGGPSAVTDQALAATASGRATERVAGANRYETAAGIAARAFPDGSDRTYLANGVTMADAVAGGSLSRGPVLLVPPDCRVLPEATWRRLSTEPPARLTALGGTAAVCTEQLATGARMAVFSPWESAGPGRLHDLVTKTRAVDPLRHVPSDLTGWRTTSHELRPEVGTMLEALFDGAAAAGKGGLYVRSAFRSYEEQQATYDYWVDLVGREQADLISAKPGHSEHQLGLAVDLGSRSCDGWDCFDDTPEGRWVVSHAHRYGFIGRYPEGGTRVTGYAYEPWHLRYVGPRAAWMMHVRDRRYWDTYQPVAVADATF